MFVTVTAKLLLLAVTWPDIFMSNVLQTPPTPPSDPLDLGTLEVLDISICISSQSLCVTAFFLIAWHFFYDDGDDDGGDE